MALGKTRDEIRNLPNRAYNDWKLYEMVEPFGFPDREYRTAAVLTKIHNAASDRIHAKSVQDFTRDLISEVLKSLTKLTAEEAEQARLAEMTPEERREYTLQKVKEAFMVPDRRKHDNRRNDRKPSDTRR